MVYCHHFKQILYHHFIGSNGTSVFFFFVFFFVTILQGLSLSYAKPEDHWSCIAHLSAEDILKSAVIEEKKCRQLTRAKILMSTGRLHHYGHLLQD